MSAVEGCLSIACAEFSEASKYVAVRVHGPLHLTSGQKIRTPARLICAVECSHQLLE